MYKKATSEEWDKISKVLSIMIPVKNQDMPALRPSGAVENLTDPPTSHVTSTLAIVDASPVPATVKEPVDTSALHSAIESLLALDFEVFVMSLD